MNLTNTVLDGHPLIKLGGSLTIDSVAAAKQTIVAAMTDAGTAQFDLSAVEECDTAGVQLMLMVRMEARARGLTFSTRDQSATFRSAVQRIGIPAAIFENSEQRSN